MCEIGQLKHESPFVSQWRDILTPMAILIGICLSNGNSIFVKMAAIVASEL